MNCLLFAFRGSHFCYRSEACTLRHLQIAILMITGIAVCGCGRNTEYEGGTGASSVSSPVSDSQDGTPASPEQRRPDLTLDLPLVNSNPGYLGAKVCGECHQERLLEFQKTRHFAAASKPDERLMPRGFEQQTSIDSHLPGVEFLTTRRGDQFIQSVRRAGSQQESGRAVIGMAYGINGIADEVYFAWKGNKLRELPLGWLHSHDAWGAQQFSDPTSSDDFSRVATTRCLECHNTWFEHRKGTPNEYDPKSFLMGVTCERCHGPGQDHVEFHRQNPQEKHGKRITHPGHFTRDQSMDNCGQCHSGGVFRKTDLFSFRPGDSLDDHFRQNENPNYEDDHVANQVKYLKQSRCYVESSSLTCVTCHSPHHQTTIADQGDNTCRSCHQPESCTERDQLPDEIQGRCASCHMPKYSRLAVRFHTKDDRYVFPVRPTQHRIAVYPEARDAILAEWYADLPEQKQTPETRSELARLKQQLAQHFLSVATRMTGDYRYFAAIGALRDALRWDDSDSVRVQLAAAISTQTKIDQHFSRAMQLQQQNRFEDAVTELRELLVLKPDHAMALAKVGTFLAVLGKEKEATSHLAESLKHDPDNSYGNNMLGWLAYLRGDFSTASENFRQAEEIYPYTAENNYRWALALIELMQWNAAQQKLQHALSIDPNDAMACAALSRVLTEQNQVVPALQYANRAAVLTDFKNAEILVRLMEAWDGAGYPDNGLSTAKQAYLLPGVRESQWADVLRQRITAPANHKTPTSHRAFEP